MRDWRHAGERPKCQPVTRNCALPAEISHSTSVASHLLPHPVEYGVPGSSWLAGDAVCEDRRGDRKDWFVDEERGVRILWHKLWGLREGGTSSSERFERRWDNYPEPKVPPSSCHDVMLIYGSGWWILQAVSIPAIQVHAWPFSPFLHSLCAYLWETSTEKPL